MIEDGLKYCPQCRDEYRPEIAVCAACGIPLLTGVELAARDEAGRKSRRQGKGPLTAEDDLLAVHQAPLGELRHLQALLEAEGIASLIGGAEQGCGKSCGPPRHCIEVRREDAIDAQRIITEELGRMAVLSDHQAIHGDAVFNPDADEAVCPACGFTFATESTVCPDCGLCFG